jgi:hypothetical protein
MQRQVRNRAALATLSASGLLVNIVAIELLVGCRWLRTESIQTDSILMAAG